MTPSKKTDMSVTCRMRFKKKAGGSYEKNHLFHLDDVVGRVFRMQEFGLPGGLQDETA
jgi:hypothetical protein